MSLQLPEEVEPKDRPAPGTIQIITHWISSCNWLHPDCQPASNRDGSPRIPPSWVIDTQSGCIVPGASFRRYAALTYVWPKTENEGGRLELNISTLGPFQELGFLYSNTKERLPEVINDTIELAKRLGERYLWIDRLCIVQDGEMKHDEVQRMDSIYTGAYFTVIAAASSGLHGNPELRVQPPQPSGYQDRTESVFPDHFYGQLLKSKWATRGWTFQEQILSRRSIIFIDGDVFWDCQRTLWCSDNGPEFDTTSPCSEPGQLMADDILPLWCIDGGPEFDTTSPRDGPGQLMANDISSAVLPDFRMYSELVCLYSDRDLTYPQDTLLAFSGILTSFTRTFPGGFVGGLPRLFLDHALLWQPFDRKCKRRIPVRGREDYGDLPSAHLPSWSWCGWQVTVDPESLQTGVYLGSTRQTRNLVQWSVLSEDLQREEMLGEPASLEDYSRRFLEGRSSLPEGWACRGTPDEPVRKRVRSDSPCSSGSSETYFTHEADSRTRFKHPIPVTGCNSWPTPSPSTCVQAWPYLCCETTTGHFCVESLLSYLDTHRSYSLSCFKVPVDSLERFRCGPPDEDICRILCLNDVGGRPAGLLRLMEDTEIAPGQELELVAISSGSSVHPLREEAIDLHESWRYEYGNTSVIHDFKRDPPVGEDIGRPYFHVEVHLERDRLKRELGRELSAREDRDVRKKCRCRENQWRNARSGKKEKWRRTRPWGRGGGEYHFYNVLWIERKDGIAYRRAAGRVAKDAWEANCKEKSKVILG